VLLFWAGGVGFVLPEFPLLFAGGCEVFFTGLFGNYLIEINLNANATVLSN
jgi:hypothetical protein